MAPLKAGDDFPEGVTFTYIPPAPETSEFSACGMPIKYNASKGEFCSYCLHDCCQSVMNEC